MKKWSEKETNWEKGKKKGRSEGKIIDIWTKNIKNYFTQAWRIKE